MAAGGRVNGPESPQEGPDGPLAGSGGRVHPQDASPDADGPGLLVPLLLVVRVNPLRKPISPQPQVQAGGEGRGFPMLSHPPNPGMPGQAHMDALCRPGPRPPPGGQLSGQASRPHLQLPE